MFSLFSMRSGLERPSHSSKPKVGESGRTNGSVNGSVTESKLKVTRLCFLMGAAQSVGDTSEETVEVGEHALVIHMLSEGAGENKEVGLELLDQSDVASLSEFVNSDARR